MQLRFALKYFITLLYAGKIGYTYSSHIIFFIIIIN